MSAFPASFRTARLTLRQPDDEAARLEHEMIHESLDHLWPWFDFLARPPTVADRVALAAQHRADAGAGTGVTYLVFDGDRAVGKVWLEAEGAAKRIGWYLRATATGRGFATEAVRGLSDLAFEHGIDRLEAHVDTDNAPSRAVAERAGFALERIVDDAYDRHDGVRRPECLYVRLTRSR